MSKGLKTAILLLATAGAFAFASYAYLQQMPIECDINRLWAGPGDIALASAILFFVSPVAVVVGLLLLVGAVLFPAKRRQSATKTCPSCAKEIELEALQCRDCGFQSDPQVVADMVADRSEAIEQRMRKEHETRACDATGIATLSLVLGAMGTLGLILLGASWASQFLQFELSSMSVRSLETSGSSSTVNHIIEVPKLIGLIESAAAIPFACLALLMKGSRGNRRAKTLAILGLTLAVLDIAAAKIIPSLFITLFLHQT